MFECDLHQNIRGVVWKSQMMAIFASSSFSLGIIKTDTATGYAELFYNTLLIYKAMLLMVLTWEPYNHIWMQKLDFSWFKQNLHHLFHFVYR